VKRALSAPEPVPRLAELGRTGFWFCRCCQRVTERVEREQGLPAGCRRCESPRIHWVPPIDAEAAA
jgi:hypothetical protein